MAWRSVLPGKSSGALWVAVGVEMDGIDVMDGIDELDEMDP